jgi:hypothetical protein
MVLTFFCTGYLLLNSLKIPLAKKLFNHEKYVPISNQLPLLVYEEMEHTGHFFIFLYKLFY